MTTVLQHREISERTRSLSTLGRIDYSDVATIETSVQAAPETWARAIIEQTAGTGAQVFWHAIGLRLDRRSPRNIGGWTLVATGGDHIVLETSSFYATINAIGEVDQGRVSLALLARFDHPFARIACPPITLVHRRGIGLLLRGAAHRLGRHQP
ncbi:MAG: hypothetical protein WD646_10090 [Actinomycetota bacterium]